MIDLNFDEAHDAAAIIASTHDLVLQAQKPQLVDDAPYVVSLIVPRGDEHKLIDLEQYQDHPRRKIARPTFTTTESLAAYVIKHARAGTTLYANPDGVSVEAILDDHSDTDPGHRDHRATLKLIRTPGCLRWLNAHGKYLEQEAFAQLIEDGLTEIARPDGAELLEIAQSITATKNASFRSDRRLATGRVQFQWHEEIDASAGQSGDLAIPDQVTLVFEPFYGATPVQLDARFRYRLANGKLTMGFWLIRHEEALREAFAAELDRLGVLLAAEIDAPPILFGAS